MSSRPRLFDEAVLVRQVRGEKVVLLQQDQPQRLLELLRHAAQVRVLHAEVRDRQRIVRELSKDLRVVRPVLVQRGKAGVLEPLRSRAKSPLLLSRIRNGRRISDVRLRITNIRTGIPGSIHVLCLFVLSTENKRKAQFRLGMSLSKRDVIAGVTWIGPPIALPPINFSPVTPSQFRSRRAGPRRRRPFRSPRTSSSTLSATPRRSSRVRHFLRSGSLLRGGISRRSSEACTRPERANIPSSETRHGTGGRSIPCSSASNCCSRSSGRSQCCRDPRRGSGSRGSLRRYRSAAGSAKDRGNPSQKRSSAASS